MLDIPCIPLGTLCDVGHERRGDGPNTTSERSAAEQPIKEICEHQRSQENRSQRHREGGDDEVHVPSL